MAWPADGPLQQQIVAGRYRLLALLGRGGSAEVWRAEDEALGREVAVKIVMVPTDDSAARAGEEARLLARLSHPGLVPVYDAGTDERSRPWVVMELVEGETLAGTISRGPMPSHQVAVVGRSVAEALGYVHAQGLIHRDVKPANVLVGADDRVRLTDFGIARLVDAAKVTATGMTVGTASYLAPEQVLGEAVGPAADVYALGLVLLECLTGHREYAGNTVEVALARLHRPPEVPDALPAGWPGLLRAMTARSPASRPAPARIAEDLGRVLSGGAAVTVLAPRDAPDQGVAVRGADLRDGDDPDAGDRTRVLQRTSILGTVASAAAAAAAAAGRRNAPAGGPPASAPPPQARQPQAPPQRGRAVPERTRRRGGRLRRALTTIALIFFLTLGAGVYYLVQQFRGVGLPVPPLPAVDTNVPDNLRRDIERLQREVQGR